MIQLSSRHRASRRVAKLALVAALLGAACQDPFKLTATQFNSDLGFVVWALTGTPDEYPTALQVPQATLVRPDPAGNFDLAFDIDASGKLIVFPVGTVVTPLIGAHRVQFIETDAVFAQILSAPTTGWQTDSSIVVDVGDAFLVRVNGPFCQFQLRQEIYAKFSVDSIIPAERRARLRGRLNPNCGFRSFQDGIPEF